MEKTVSLIPMLKLSTIIIIIIERFILFGVSCSTSTTSGKTGGGELLSSATLTLSFKTEPASDHRSKNNNDDSQTNEDNDFLLKKEKMETRRDRSVFV